MDGPLCWAYEGEKDQRQRATGNLIGDRSARASLAGEIRFQVSKERSRTRAMAKPAAQLVYDLGV